jgi:hypothetical protein
MSSRIVLGGRGDVFDAAPFSPPFKLPDENVSPPAIGTSTMEGDAEEVEEEHAPPFN